MDFILADRALSWQPESEKLSGLEYRMVGRGWWVLWCFSLAHYNSRLNLLEAFYVIFRLILVVGWTHSRSEFLAPFDVIKVAAVVCKIVSSFYAHIKSLWRVISCLYAAKYFLKSLFLYKHALADVDGIFHVDVASHCRHYVYTIKIINKNFSIWAIHFEIN